VKTILAYYGLDEYHALIMEWYNGYQFGNTNVYCPWDVISYIRELRSDKTAKPKPYWINSSGNAIIKRFLRKADKNTKREIEQLIEGYSVRKDIKQELTYTELEDSIDNMWSVLYSTGYLTTRNKPDGKAFDLVIPNREVHEIYVTQIREWFERDVVRGNPMKLSEFCGAFNKGDANTIQQLFTSYLKSAISIRDTFTKGKKENFYHGILLGLLSSKEEWLTFSSLESGEGYCDILVEMEDGIGCVIEVKYGERSNLDNLCEAAMDQIDKMNYIERLQENGVTTIYKYGIACFKKECRVICREGRENG
jgi:hypothetical protein